MGQILRYLATAEIESEGHIRWGILTNGSVWRLYDYRARPRASGFFEADLAELLKPGKEDDLRVFHLLFRRESFTLRDGATTTFLEAALAEGRRYEEQVAQDLSGVVFEQVFPNLVNALAKKPGGSLAESRDAALIFSIGCCLCSMPRTGGCCRSTMSDTTTMVCESPSATRLRAGWRLMTRTRRLLPIITTI